jgi:hypothetical protein
LIIENIAEELDAENEYYYDKATRVLRIKPNATMEWPPKLLVATKLQTLVKLEGTQAAPVLNISFSGFGWRDAAHTYMERWGVWRKTQAAPRRFLRPENTGSDFVGLLKIECLPTQARDHHTYPSTREVLIKRVVSACAQVPSGGDWSLYHGAALHIHGAVGTKVSGCDFQRLDNNAIILTGFTRNVPAPVNISTTASQIQIGWSPRSKCSFER